MDDLSKLRFHESLRNAPVGPAFYRGHFDLKNTGDTFLDTRGWGKGAVWINGHALGRFWSLGPLQTLYVPAPWLRKGTNEIVVFTQAQPHDARLRGLRQTILDELDPSAN
jgi:beta-galactosidase